MCWASLRKLGGFVKFEREDQYHKQRHRYCKSSQKDMAFCPGRWLEHSPCGLCLNPAQEDENYNYEMDFSSRAHFIIKFSKKQTFNHADISGNSKTKS